MSEGCHLAVSIDVYVEGAAGVRHSTWGMTGNL